MRDKGSARLWLLAGLAVVVGGLGYYLYAVNDSDTAKEQEEAAIASVEEVQVQPEERPAIEDESVKKQGAPATLETEQPASSEGAKQVVKGKIGNRVLSAINPEASPDQKELYCRKMDEYVVDYLTYLNEDIQPDADGNKVNSLDYFRRILKDLEKRPPVPAGEGSSPTVMISNIFYFSRALDRKDIAFIRNIIGSDKDTLEVNMDMIFRWLMLENTCNDSNVSKPSFDMLYRYAGFFLNTIGGRAYMFRRSTDIRLLTTYYSLLIIHKADRLGLNQYGIDILPFVKSAKKEITRYADFELQNEYINNLLMMEKYYTKRR